ncbi:hypothetical protein B0A55_05624 [Friedmanniomyces simplex]|uniref:RGS domain-containing protein n=1 Tax=Friedmanniomyces simplex TaxID=329884 RepID=A0A4U0XGB1_9PEZI|nr:hypothetical protein B0A55_05624 [Friedmanniomyces simplex]
MVYSLTYRRPSHVRSSASRDSLSGDDKQKSINDSITSGSSCMSNGIPEALSFDRIISGGVCPPCTVRDFMNYLRYIEHSAENLQFFLWYRDYCARWEKLPESEKALAPVWTAEQAEAEVAGNASQSRPKRINPQVAAVLRDTDFADGAPKHAVDKADPFITPARSSVDDKKDLMSDYGSSMGDETLASSTMHQSVANQAFDDAGMKWKPFTLQPYRDEIGRIISVYIAGSSSRELNLSARERQAVLHALQNTTHPTAFRSITRTVEYSLRKQAHPNFVRWTICNGNRPRVVFARGLGIAGILAGFTADLLLTLSHASRPWRVIPFLAWFIGIATLIAAWKGIFLIMVYSLTYHRPSHVRSSASRDSLSGDEKQKSINDSITSGLSCMSNGIPEALSFDRIISGGVCPPCTVRDFMNYLRYIEHSAENLQFFLWYRDYCARWETLPESEKALAPVWTAEQAEAEVACNAFQSRPKRINPQVAAVLRDTDFADGAPKHAMDKADPLITPARSSVDDKKDPMSDYGSSMGDETLASSTTHRSMANQAFDDAGMKWKPFTLQPYRDEIDRIISVYIAGGSSRELNLSARERQALLHALQNTTHPTAFRSIIRTVEYSLRKQAHPNFVRWTICNGNRPRVVFARGLGIAGILAGFTADLLITLSHASRPWRVIPFLAWFIGIATLIAAWKGMCVVLHGLHHRHLRPWELFSDEPGDLNNEKWLSQDTLTSESGNSFEDEPWVPRYRKRNVIRKIFDRQIWIEEPALRQIQDTIFLQAVLGGFVVSCVVVGIFCGVPRGDFY